MKKTKYTIAIIDEEQQERNRFINFFENDFDVIEISNFSSVGALLDVINSEKIDAIAIDYKLKEHSSRFKVNGDFIFRELISELGDYPAFIITNNSGNAKRESKKINPFFIIDKSKIHLSSGKEKKDFINEINNIIKGHKAKIEVKMKRLSALEKLKRKKKLNEKLENEFLDLNNEIAKNITGKSPIPLKYFSQETNKKLDKIIKKTDELIERISKKK